MRNRRMLAAINAAALLWSAPPVWSECTFNVQKTSLPPLVGKLVFESCNSDCTQSHIYLYDFSNPGLHQIDKTNWQIAAPTNPALTPDGRAVMFSAIDLTVNPTERDLYYWKIHAATPYNLTVASSDRDEDGKFSSDGKHVVWKITAGNQSEIVMADLTFPDGTPTLVNQRTVATGGVGDSTETSGPTFSPTRKYIYYYESVQDSETVWRVEVGAQTPPQLMEAAYAFYPVDPDLYEFLYAGWPNHSSPDKIFVASLLTGTATPWNANDCNADNDDPAPVDEDYFFYSRRDRTMQDSRYKLYLGQISTGYAWSLDSLKINGRSGNREGANYVNAGQVPPPGRLQRR